MNKFAKIKGQALSMEVAATAALMIIFVILAFDIFMVVFGFSELDAAARDAARAAGATTNAYDGFNAAQQAAQAHHFDGYFVQGGVDGKPYAEVAPPSPPIAYQTIPIPPLYATNYTTNPDFNYITNPAGTTPPSGSPYVVVTTRCLVKVPIAISFGAGASMSNGQIAYGRTYTFPILGVPFTPAGPNSSAVAPVIAAPSPAVTAATASTTSTAANAASTSNASTANAASVANTTSTNNANTTSTVAASKANTTSTTASTPANQSTTNNAATTVNASTTNAANTKATSTANAASTKGTTTATPANQSTTAASTANTTTTKANASTSNANTSSTKAASQANTTSTTASTPANQASTANTTTTNNNATTNNAATTANNASTTNNVATKANTTSTIAGQTALATKAANGG